MADNTNVNNNAAVVVVGRTAPVPPGQQRSEKSIPVVIASDQATIPVAEQNKIQSEVALSLLGIPRSEVALGIFADVNTYDVNPSEWAANPEQFSEIANVGIYSGIPGDPMGWGLTHVPEESGALVEAPADKVSVLTSKRFFRYQPGRVSSATFGVKTTLNNVDGSNVYNPSIRKYGIFDNYDGYYWESRNNGDGDNFCVVRRTQSIIYENPNEFNVVQTEDYGRTNPQDSLSVRGSESVGAGDSNPAATPKKFGDLVILRDNLLMTHAAVYDPSLLQNEYQVGITSTYNSSVISLAGLAKSVTNAVYNINTGLMVITTSTPHGFEEGKFVTLSGIGMTCDLNPAVLEIYPKSGRNNGYNILTVGTTTSFTVNVGVSTVPTFYNSGGHVIGLSTDQYVSYSKGTNSGIITGFSDGGIYRVRTVGVNTLTGISTVTLSTLNGNLLTSITATSGISSHVLITPVPFIQPTDNSLIGVAVPKVKYGNNAIKETGLFPYMYSDGNGLFEGYVDTTATPTTLKSQIDDVNTYYNKWVNQSVKKEYWNVYEYRVPRSRFSGDRLDNATDNLLYSDSVGVNKAGEIVRDENTQEIIQDTSIWNLDLTKVTMYKVEFSWYGAVGALFLAYVPVSNGEARWVRVHHLRASNQLKVASLGNATLPITYLVYGGGSEVKRGYVNSTRTGGTTFSGSYGSPSEHIIKYGASYYIDGGDRGTVKLYSYATEQPNLVYGSKRVFGVTAGAVGVGTTVNLTNATDATNPRITAGTATGLATSYYVGSKVITTNPLDQNIQITFINGSDLLLNSPLNSSSLPNITIIPNRPTPLIGLKCRDFILSSTGKSVRNRTQVYPTRLSTGSTGVLKIDLLKSPIFQTLSTTTGTISLTSPVNIGKRGNPTPVLVNNSNYLAANTGVYGYFRGYFELDASERRFSVLGYLENKGQTGYYFYALKSSSDNIILSDAENFLKEENTTPTGTIVTPAISESTLSQLSTVKTVVDNRTPIPGTGTVVTTLFVPASGEDYDLSPFFDYNKDYLSFPLTNEVESLYLCATSQTPYNALLESAEVSASITWEEQ